MKPTLRDMLLLTLIGLLAFLPGLASLPVIDRDEARYAQATVQMVETGNYIDIRFQDEPRYKKPVGAYWAQAAALHLTGQADNVRAGERPIWAQRLPSVIGALIAVLATYLTGMRLFSRRAALIGASLLAVSVSLVFEAHQAKTDALLAGACAVVLYGLAARNGWAVWLGIAAGVLLKGPVILGVTGLALGSLYLVRKVGRPRIKSGDRVSQSINKQAPGKASALSGISQLTVGRWLLAPLPILVALALTLPWFIAIHFISDGAFYAEALGRDFGAKLGSAQETHGGWPGYYLLTGLIMFWPGIIVVPLAALWAWRNRRLPAVTLLLCWLVPMWIVLELVPTKLPHYTLPLYPALALLSGAAVAERFPASLPKWAVTYGSVSLLIIIGFFGWAAPGSDLLDLSPRLVNATDARPIISPYYREPSLVYLAGTDTRLDLDQPMTNGVLILDTETRGFPGCATSQSVIEGFNYAKGRALLLDVFTTDGCAPAELETWRARAAAR